jgi:hypothetical protein
VLWAQHRSVTSLLVQECHFSVGARMSLLCWCKSVTSLLVQECHFSVGARMSLLCWCKNVTFVLWVQGHFCVVGTKSLLCCGCKNTTSVFFYYLASSAAKQCTLKGCSLGDNCVVTCPHFCNVANPAFYLFSLS